MGKRSKAVITTADAREVIEEVARRKGTFTAGFKREAEEEAANGRSGMLQAIEGSEEIRQDLAKTLNIISADLYTNRARFLMEVIQNGDDNNYAEGVTPTVCITVRPNHVKIECNEKGFSRDNVLTLCRTGRSTKKPGSGYTGEKGIGFKSVFKLANRAHVRSPPYYFQLDKRRDLGMITPQWDEEFFADYHGEYQTALILDNICDEKPNFAAALRKDVNAIDPVLILFLRRIERLHLDLHGAKSSEEGDLSKHFRRLDWTPGSGIVSIQDEKTAAVRSWYKHPFTVSYGGNEPRRLGITKTDIVLAFPIEKVSKTYTPSIHRNNSTFAFLPLGKFGFKFVIQADFLTASNRESIAEDNDWNQNIAAEIPRAFEAAISHLNSCGEDSELNKLAKTWPLYLDDNASGTSEYWRSIKTEINSYLSKAPVLKHRANGFQAPKSLLFLDWAHDRDSNPLLGEDRDYVSSEYPKELRQALLLLGVEAPDWTWVCRKVKESHVKGFLRQKMKSKEWCSDLAKVLIQANIPNYTKNLGDVPLIPLDDGSWRCAPSAKAPIHFPATDGTTIPPGLPLLLVEKDACDCPSRERLFRLLGVKECNVGSVIERIFHHHANFNRANAEDIIAQLKYLYAVRKHLKDDIGNRICFECSPSAKTFRSGAKVYADISSDGELRQLFSGYNNAYFLTGKYFEDHNDAEKRLFAQWLHDKTGVATAPRLFDAVQIDLHNDFKWSLFNRTNQVLEVLQKYWHKYRDGWGDTQKWMLGSQSMSCISGESVPLCETYLPLATLVEKAEAYGDVKKSNLGVQTEDNLEFYLWMLNQPGFKDGTNVTKSKDLFMQIQSRSFTPSQVSQVREEFRDREICLSDGIRKIPKSCVWQGPKGFSVKPSLCTAYGGELRRFLQDILRVPDATCADALDCLEKLRNVKSATVADAAEIYLYILKHPDSQSSVVWHKLLDPWLMKDRILIPRDDEYIAVQPPSGSGLEWKTWHQCVWDDAEFSQNELQLESKTAIRRIFEPHGPMLTNFFTQIYQLPSAGIRELIADLQILQKRNDTDGKRVFRLYERIETHRRASAAEIRDAFTKAPLVFLPDEQKGGGKWLSVRDCLWNKSVLQHKHVLAPYLSKYSGLFRETLSVPNANVGMLLKALLSAEATVGQNSYQYIKVLLLEIARLRPNPKELEQLASTPIWPCCLPNLGPKLCRVGSFYVNDRQGLFDIFHDSHTFLDFGFEASKSVAALLRGSDCANFISQKVQIETEPCGAIREDAEFEKGFRARADALFKYFAHTKCESPHNLRPLLKTAKVWQCETITTCYTLKGTTVTKDSGGSSVKISTGNNRISTLEIFVSTDKKRRDCALMTEFPRQLASALKLKPTNLPELQSLLLVSADSLQALLIDRGIIGGDEAEDTEEIDTDEAPFENSKNGATEINARGSGDGTLTQSADNMASAQKVLPFPSTFSTQTPSSANHQNSQLTANSTRRGLAHHHQRGVHGGANRNESGSSASRVPIGSSNYADRDLLTRAEVVVDRTEDERRKDAEVGYLGEYFVYSLLRKTLALPGFTGELNWTSSLRVLANLSPYGQEEVSDFTYKDVKGVLTRCFLKMRHSYQTPEWLSTACQNGNAPVYRIEVKTTSSRDPTAAFHMSAYQYELAESLRVTSARPAEVYVILRVSGLDVGETKKPQWRVYLDPYTLGEDGVLDFVAPAYAVMANE